jgi:hypothetical protein
MSSKSRGGLSKREYAAKQSGGSLNYKTGKISTPKKSSSSSKKSSSYGTDPSLESEMGYIASPEYQQSLDSGYKMSDAEFSSKNSDYNKKKSSSSNKSSSTNKAFNDLEQRATAAKAYNQPSTIGNIIRSGLGVNTAQASSRPGATISQTPQKSWWERGLEIAKDPFGLEPRSRSLFSGGSFNDKVYQTEASGADSINQLLQGISPRIDVSNNQVVGDQNQPYDSQNDNNVPTPYKSWDTYNQNKNRPQSQPIGNTKDAGMNDYIANYVPGGQAPTDYMANYTPDNVQVQPDNGTVRQFLGSGELASGQYGNGAGNYGAEGALGGGGLNWTLEDLMQTLGLSTPTAQAQETPNNYGFNSREEYLQNNTNPVPGLSDPTQYNTYDNIPTWNNDMSDSSYNMYQRQIDKLLADAGLPPEGANQEPVDNLVNTTGINTGYQAGVDPQQQYIKQQNKALKSQANAEKKAWRELQKSINEQYDTAGQLGTRNLNTSNLDSVMSILSAMSNANQTPDSEQAQQYQQRNAQDYSQQLGDMNTKLATSRKADLKSGKSSYQSAIQQIQEQQAAKKYQLAMLLYNAAKKKNASYSPWDGSTDLTSDAWAV